jgi:hypothetical protein
MSDWFEINKPKPAAKQPAHDPWFDAYAVSGGNHSRSVSLDEHLDSHAKRLGLKSGKALNPRQRREAQAEWKSQHSSGKPAAHDPWFDQFAAAPSERPPKYLAELVRAKHRDAYNDLTDHQLEGLVRRKFPDAYRDIPSTPHTPARAENHMPPPQPAHGSGLGRFASGAWDMLNPVEMVKGVVTAVTPEALGGRGPLNTIGDLANAQIDQFRQAAGAARQGRYSEAVGHGIAGAVPIVGPAAANVGERIGQGDVAGGLGAATGLVSGTLAPGAIARNVKAVNMPSPVRNRNAAQVEAVEAGRRAGVPLDAATATGNRFVAGAQHLADRTIAGSFVAQKAAQRQAASLATRGEQLAAKSHASPVTAEAAGQGVRDAIRGQMRKHAGEADTAYSRLREIEADPRHAKTVTLTEQGRLPGGDPIAVPLERTVALPVDLRAAKEALAPIHADLLRQSQLTPLMGHRGRALVALDRIAQAPDHASLSTVDAALSELKAFARPDGSGLRTAGQGAVGQAIRQLDEAVRATAQQAGPEAVQALNAGRAATVAKYLAADALKGLGKDGVRAYRKLVARDDSAIGQLRELAKHAPDELPKIGRAYLDDLLGQATKGGGFEHAAKIANKWETLGEQTKRTLFKDPGYVKELDDFFRLARMSAQNANPSGTAHALATLGQGGTVVSILAGVAEPLTGLTALFGPAAVSKVLHSKAGVQLLTKGIRIPLGNKAARAAWAGEVSMLAEKLGIWRMMPATAERDDTPATFVQAR